MKILYVTLFLVTIFSLKIDCAGRFCKETTDDETKHINWLQQTKWEALEELDEDILSGHFSQETTEEMVVERDELLAKIISKCRQKFQARRKFERNQAEKSCTT